MAEFEVEIKTLSPIHLGSGGADVNIDSDICRDAFGLPYFPAKRFKGLLYESALEIFEMFELADFDRKNLPNLDKLFNKKYFSDADAETQLIVTNFYIQREKKYKKLCDDWKYLQEKYSAFFSPADVLETFTNVRYQTKLVDGVAEDSSLRNLRVLDSGTNFFGKIILLGGDEKILTLLALAIKNLSLAGTKRNRGFGKINCSIKFDDDKDENFYFEKWRKENAKN